MMQANKLDVVTADLCDSGQISILKEQIDTLPIDYLVAVSPRPRFETTDEYVLFVIRVPCDTADLDFASLRVMANTRSAIIIADHFPSQIKATLKTLQQPSLKALMLALFNASLQIYNDVVSDLDEAFDEIEDTVFSDKPMQTQEKLALMRQEVIMARRHAFAQRESLGTHNRPTAYAANKSQMKWLNDIHFEFMRLVERLDSLRDRAVVIQESLMTLTQSQLNSKVYLLSVVTVLFLPLSFITGLLGINVAGIPGSQDAVAFGVVCGLLGLLLVVEIIVFKLYRWF